MKHTKMFSSCALPVLHFSFSNGHLDFMSLFRSTLKKTEVSKEWLEMLKLCLVSVGGDHWRSLWTSFQENYTNADSIMHYGKDDFVWPNEWIVLQAFLIELWISFLCSPEFGRGNLWLLWPIFDPTSECRRPFVCVLAATLGTSSLSAIIHASEAQLQILD